MIDWQDLVLTAGSVVFLAALIPTILGPDKPARSTSASTGSVLLVFAATYLTLDLYFAASVTALTALAWLTIFVQSVKR
jgi:hypothetical protein